MEIILSNLPKVSLNDWYEGMSWMSRHKMKKKYIWIVKSQFKNRLSKNNQYSVCYDFFFISRPLDPSNCSAMLKMIEDIIFENDSYKIIKPLTISSDKSDGTIPGNYVKINIKTL